VARIARVHQEGLTDKVDKKRGPEYDYPIRPLLGFTPTEKVLIRDALLRHLEAF
jgi:hypothetical protein